MDLQQLRTFVAISQEGNLTRASAKLCLSQPAVSAQLKALEDELNLKLFERGARGMELTPAGKVLLEEASSALSAAGKIFTTARELVGGIGEEFKLGTISEPVILRLSEFLFSLMNTHPEVKLTISQGISGDIIERVLDSSIHAGYVIGEVQDPRIAAIKIAPITLRIVAPVAWRQKINSASWQNIAQLPWIATPTRCSFNKIATQMFARHNVTPQTVIEADQETTLKALVSNGIGLTLLREDVALAAESRGEISIWDSGIEVSHLYFIYLRSEEDEPIMKAMISLVRDVWKLSNQLAAA